MAKSATTSATDGVVPRSIGRALDLLEAVLNQRRCNLTTAADATGLTPTTALRYLRALEKRGYLDRDSIGIFSVGPTLLRVAASLHDAGLLERMVATAQPHLDSLASVTGESAYLAVSDGRVATYVATAESVRAIRHVGGIGQKVPLKGSAVGAALANPGTPAVVTGAVEPDITSVSLALSGDRALGLALSVVGPRHRLDRKACAAVESALKVAVGALTKSLGLDVEMIAS